MGDIRFYTSFSVSNADEKLDRGKLKTLAAFGHVGL
jgi:hypothetical protein